MRKRLGFGGRFPHFLFDDFLGVTSFKILDICTFDVLKLLELLYLLVEWLGIEVME